MSLVLLLLLPFLLLLPRFPQALELMMFTFLLMKMITAAAMFVEYLWMHLLSVMFLLLTVEMILVRFVGYPWCRPHLLTKYLCKVKTVMISS